MAIDKDKKLEKLGDEVDDLVGIFEHRLLNALQRAMSPEEAPEELRAFVNDHLRLLADRVMSSAASFTKTEEDFRVVDGSETYPGGITVDQVRWLRSLYGLDQIQKGIRFDAHTMGLPSTETISGQDRLLEHWGNHGVEGWYEGEERSFLAVKAQFKALVADLLGTKPEHVLHGPHASGLIREILLAATTDARDAKIFYDLDHFSTVHKMMGDSRLAISPVTIDFNAEILVIDEDADIIMLSHGGYKTGKIQDLKETVAKIRSQAPLAIIIIDSYQTSGTVPINLEELGPNVAIVSGAHKQHNSAAGAGFAAFSEGTLENLEPYLPGWWSEEKEHQMWSFRDEAATIKDEADASKLQTGSQDFFAQARLVAELEILQKLGNGSIQRAVEMIRAKSLHQLRILRASLTLAGLSCVSPEKEQDLPSYLVFEHPKAKILEELFRARFIYIDSREDRMRISVNKATTDKEVVEGCETIAEILEHLNSMEHQSST